MSVLLQISDPHFGTERPPVVEALAALARQQRPDLLVLSGDITQRARPAQFQAARSFMDRLGVPLLAVPGNHDIPLLDVWTRLRRPYARHVAAFGSELEPVHTSPDLMVVGVNTTRARRYKHGEVSGLQIDRVARTLAGARAEQLRVVVVHQPAAVTRAEERVNLLRGHQAALRAWSAAGADLVLGGHIHLPYTLAPNGLARRLWVVQAGTAVSSRIRLEAPNSVNILRWGASLGARAERARAGAEAGKDCLIEQWDFARQEHAFVRTAVTAVEPERA